MFMLDKPHRYETKMFMICDSKTAYCHRCEELLYVVYVGKRDVGDTQADAVDHKIGAAAVIRNLKVVLANNRLAYHAVVVDRFYSSIPLAVELLTMSVYIVGTIMTNRLGFSRNVRETRRTRPSSIPRGSFTFSRSVAVPSMVVFHWWDRKPVHYLCTGSAMAESTIKRNVKRVGPITVPCPSASLFLGFLDLAMVTAYLSHKEACKLNGTTAMKRGEWYSVLQNQLLQLKAQDFQGITVTPPTRSGQETGLRKKTRRELQMDARSRDGDASVTSANSDMNDDDDFE
ncbi:uncharacterized protein IUM83_01177 [Phytophthora cinnamomi]|uniref:uncharacterized protein n=1 Tax=Phytophthora cinnamomi TaxID=4785 RepID=UPI0035599A44|nr:hypothetical protein IUM83_01177 [Phytophthora cinnamomi]